MTRSDASQDDVEPDELPPIVAILGPTGVGKSGLAMRLAAEFGGEIVCADSRQVYRRLDIGTEKPSASDRRAIRHHVIDMVDPDASYSVVDFCRDGRRALGEIGGRLATAFLVGGSGYYARSLLQGVSFPAVDSDAESRSSIEAEVRRIGAGAARVEISEIDPASAERVAPANPRRIARALEVTRKTKRPIPALDREPLRALVIGLAQDRSRLYQRLDRRVDEQVAKGLVEEARAILDMGYKAELPVLTGLAYSQMIKHLTGQWSLEEAIEAYKYATHKLVRRQMTWFGKEPRMQWLDVDAPDFTARVTDLVGAYVGGRDIADSETTVGATNQPR